jgi:hypothetical protein
VRSLGVPCSEPPCTCYPALIGVGLAGLHARPAGKNKKRKNRKGFAINCNHSHPLKVHFFFEQRAAHFHKGR